MKKLFLIGLVFLLSLFSVFANVTVESSASQSSLNDFTSCSLDYKDNLFVIIMFLFIVFLIVMAFITKQFLFGIFASFGLIFVSITLFTCFIAFGIILLSSSIFMLLYFLFASA